MCTVESVEDNTGGLRIKVRIPYFDPPKEEDPNMDRIPYCFPLMPKLIHVNPKVGELVLVMLLEQGSLQGDRFFIGPVISQDYYLNECKAAIYAQSLFQGVKLLPPMENPWLNPDNEGTIPDRDDIAVRGRDNSDVVLKKNEARVRCGFKKNPGSNATNDTLNFNRSDLAYLQEKYYPKGKTDSHGDYNSVVNIVADRINLLSHDGAPYFNMGDKDELITSDEQDNIQGSAHPLIYGDSFMVFLSKLIEIYKKHVHSFPTNNAVINDADMEVLNTDLSTFLSKTIKIN